MIVKAFIDLNNCVNLNWFPPIQLKALQNNFNEVGFLQDDFWDNYFDFLFSDKLFFFVQHIWS